MVLAEPGIRPGERVTQNPLEFWDSNGSRILGQMIWPSNCQQKKREPAN